MKKPFLLALTLSLTLTQVVRAENDNDSSALKKRGHKATAAAQSNQVVRRSSAQVRQPVARGISTNRTYAAPQRTFPNSNRTYGSRSYGNRVTGNTLSQNRDRNSRVSNTRGTNVSRQPVAVNVNHRSFDRNSYSVARSRVVRTYHDRGWWRSHYNTTFVLFGGGYYYWNSGYWYPAYGYSPIYNNYAYSEPIYGYNNLEPGQVLENVQLALRDEGYYDGPIDGLIGPQTRDALAAFQRDNGLVETAAVDEPTLVTLGLA